MGELGNVPSFSFCILHFDYLIHDNLIGEQSGVDARSRGLNPKRSSDYHVRIANKSSIL